MKKDAIVQVPLRGCTVAPLLGATKRYIYTYEINVELLTEIRTPHPCPDFFVLAKSFANQCLPKRQSVSPFRKEHLNEA